MGLEQLSIIIEFCMGFEVGNFVSRSKGAPPLLRRCPPPRRQCRAASSRLNLRRRRRNTSNASRSCNESCPMRRASSHGSCTEHWTVQNQPCSVTAKEPRVLRGVGAWWRPSSAANAAIPCTRLARCSSLHRCLRHGRCGLPSTLLQWSVSARCCVPRQTYTWFSLCRPAYVRVPRCA